MIRVTATYISGTQFELGARWHKVLADQPPDVGGADGGMTPPEILLGSLASCAGYYAAEYLKARRLPLDGLRIAVEAAKAADPARLDGFRIVVETGALEERHREGVLRAVRKCLVHNTLLHAPSIGVEVHTAGPPDSLAA
jgi:putative redox protein